MYNMYSMSGMNSGGDFDDYYYFVPPFTSSTQRDDARAQTVD